MMIQQKEIFEKLIINRDSKKCFIFDLDGTIIFKNIMLNATNENILSKIIAHGHEVVFATGRSYRDFKIVMPEWLHNHKVTLFSGSLSMGNDGKIYRNLHLSKTRAEEIIELCLRHQSPFIMDNISHYYHPPQSEFTFGFIDSKILSYQVTNLEKMLETDIYKILVFDMKLHGLFTEYAKENDLTIKYHSYDNCFDLVVDGCNKYDGVLPLLTNYAVDDVFVFGNDFNDYELLSEFPNSVVFGSIAELLRVAKLNIKYDEYQERNFTILIDTILNGVQHSM